MTQVIVADPAGHCRGCLGSVSSLSPSPPKHGCRVLVYRVAPAHALHACDFATWSCSCPPYDRGKILLPLLCPKPRIPTAGCAFVLCHLCGHSPNAKGQKLPLPCWHGSTLYALGTTTTRTGPGPTATAGQRSCFGTHRLGSPSARMLLYATLHSTGRKDPRAGDSRQGSSLQQPDASSLPRLQ